MILVYSGCTIASSKSRSRFVTHATNRSKCTTHTRTGFQPNSLLYPGRFGPWEVNQRRQTGQKGQSGGKVQENQISVLAPPQKNPGRQTRGKDCWNRKHADQTDQWRDDNEAQVQNVGKLDRKWSDTRGEEDKIRQEKLN